MSVEKYADLSTQVRELQDYMRDEVYPDSCRACGGPMEEDGMAAHDDLCPLGMILEAIVCPKPATSDALREALVKIRDSKHGSMGHWCKDIARRALATEGGE